MQLCGSAWSIAVPCGRKLFPLAIFASTFKRWYPFREQWGGVFEMGNQLEVSGAA
jgi:hypothetical protein